VSQQWSPEGYAHHAGFVPVYGYAVLDLLAPQAGERILDLGCGDGVLTEKLATAGAMVVGADSSPEMIAAAQARGLDARVIDARQLPFDNEFDAVFTNAALHWVKSDPDGPISGAYRALRSGGRFVGEFGGHGNVAAITVALVAGLERRGIPNAASLIPWYYPDPGTYRSRLERAGFSVPYIELIPRPTPLPTGMRGWLDTFARAFVAALPPGDRDAYLDEVTESLRPILCDEQGRWTADYCRLRFAARKP
jgi:SAM-dependent methyltransferase